MRLHPREVGTLTPLIDPSKLGEARRHMALHLAAAHGRSRVLVGVAALLIAAVAAVPALSGSAFDLDRYGVAVAYIIAAFGLNLAFGYAGELAIGQAFIMAAGAYVAGMMSALLGWNALIVIPVAVIVGTLIGLVTMLPGLRVQGWYLALIAMVSVLLLPHVVILGEAWTAGEYGLTGISSIEFLGYRFSDVAVYELIVAALVLVWIATANFARSGWGYRMRALRDARQAAEAIGISLGETRLVVYAVSAVPAALAGVLLAYSQRFVNADAFGMSLLLLLLTGVVLGGAGTIWGPVLGMTPLLALSFWVGPFSQFNAIVLGFALMFGVIIFPDGVVPALARFGPRLERSSEDRDDSAAPAVLEYGTSRTLAAGSESVFRANGVVKRFGGVLALDHVDFELGRGRLCGLVGPNGSGKSTFLNVLSGFIKPDEGAIRITDADIAGWPTHRIARAGVGRTFQVPQLVDECTALENIEMGLLGAEQRAILSSMLYAPAVARRRAERRERALAAFASVQLPPTSIRTPVSDLPLGLKRIVEVGRAIAPMPTLLLLDEPAAGLNDEERDQLGHLLLRLKKAGITILVVEHNVPFVMRFCDELALLENGQVTCRADLGGELPERLVAYLNYTPAAKRPELSEA